MIRNIITPHLPKGEVRHVIIGEKYRDFLEKPLTERCITPIWMPENPCVDGRLSGHADLSVNKFEENTIILSEYLLNSELFKQLNDLKYKCITVNDAEKKEYPYDAGLNICQFGSNLIYNRKTVCEELNNRLADAKLNRIDCRQGYTKCAVCIVNENSIITADSGIHDKAIANGIESLLISDGIVNLDGFEYGFIGGASFKLNQFQMAFTGMIDSLPEKNAIEHFLSVRGIEAFYLTDKKLFDIGSAILLTEYIE